MTYSAMKTELNKLGIHVSRFDGEIRVALEKKNEVSAYYTNCVIDALETGKAMTCNQ